MARISQSIQYEIDQRELDAAVAARRLANQLQEILYNGESIDVPAETKNALVAVYRPLKKAVEYFFGEDHTLVYDAAPGTPFAKKG